MKIFKLLIGALFIVTNISAQSNYAKDPESCTSIMVGKQASTDGSVMTSHTCDSWYRTWISIEPAKDYPRDTIMSIYEGLMHTEHPKDMTGVKEKGTIPQVRHTYRFLNTAYPCLNEKQLAMGETTISGRDTLQNKKGLFFIEELQRVALQRCTTARDAIRLMGSLIKEYGYADSGECLTIADQHEVWIFEVFGEGPKNIGGVWAAQRIPDDEVAVSANISRIGKLNLDDTDYFMASDNVFSVAKELGLWDGKSEFSFWKAYSGGNYFNDGPESERVKEVRACDLEAGDILIWEELKGYCDTAIHDGEKFLRVKDGKIVAMTQEDLDRFFTYRYFVAFRPCLFRLMAPLYSGPGVVFRRIRRARHFFFPTGWAAGGLHSAPFRPGRWIGPMKTLSCPGGRTMVYSFQIGTTGKVDYERDEDHRLRGHRRHGQEA